MSAGESSHANELAATGHDAVKYLEANRWRLEGRDLEGILDWIRRACGKA